MAGSFVIGRNTAFTYKGKHVDLKQIGRELAVRYVLEGSVQRGSNRMRVNVQLIDAETGDHLWAERFDKPLADLFDMQDEIVARLANQLGTELVTAEARRAERAPHPDSMELYFQGMASASKGLTPEYMAQARGFFERALALDPGNIEALVGMAGVDAQSAGRFTDDRAARIVGMTARIPRKQPDWLTAMTCWYTSAGVSSMARLGPVTPALLTRTSIRPYCSATADTTSLHCFSLVTSRWRKSPSAECGGASRMSVATTWNPSADRRLACSAPWPPAAPVTMATRAAWARRTLMARWSAITSAMR